MDLTNVRSMEIFRKLGLVQGLREQGVAAHIPYNVRISTGLSRPESITNWFHPSVNEYRIRIADKNDGTMPLEPWQRISQAIFEQWLKGRCDESPLIDARFNHRVEDLQEVENGARVTVTDQKTGLKKIILSHYAVGCDGGSSMVRRSLGIPLHGGPIPAYVLLVHFKSRDLSRLHAQGRFWHLFFVGNEGLTGAAIAQNEVDTWTTHLFLPLEKDSDSISSQEAVETSLGGLHGRYPVKIDRVLVRSTYRPRIAIAQSYSSSNGRILLAGDAAHQNIPTGGYEPQLMDSYESERRPVAVDSIEHSGVHMKVHMDVAQILQGRAGALDEDSEEGRKLRRALHEHYQKHNGENIDLGIEMGYRYQSHAIFTEDSQPPKFSPSAYIPSTYPGSRAPHMYLGDGTPIFDHYGKYFSLVEFSDGADYGSDLLLKAAELGWTPIKLVRLAGEDHAYSVWGRRLVLVRPDGHVTWRGDMIKDFAEAQRIVAAIRGVKEVVINAPETAAPPYQNGVNSYSTTPVESAVPPKFTSTVGTDAQTEDYQVERMGDSRFNAKGRPWGAPYCYRHGGMKQQ
ncbi:hypothetical protein H2202_010822 [Exophiala xenobiotica]|nr:hypothetical protein H2202_010822 [Exophiala xenobiotica]KAK5202823.1 hypothetical protein LTR41_011453 [Exophiala xenobiotica]KAK5215709.1 hypothetical protein LTR72_011263 [Exophiala xenobiotica]KAK5221565.1 hypothetical protein LTR47_010854 [Exophiala xenobiotica]KAK5245456.1 hypothetical protein LTS06_009125 [Exophiala xenobiotica]